MFIKQISVFLENHTGALREMTELLGKQGIDLMALSVADTQNFGIIRIIVFILLVLLVMNMFGSCSSSYTSSTTPAPAPKTPVPTQTTANVLTGYNPPTTTYTQVDSEELNTTEVSGVREKFTKLKGNGQDTVTIMIYMCGSDLEPITAWPPRT